MVERQLPFSVRIGASAADETLYEGVPPHLLPSLQRWVGDALKFKPEKAEEIAASLRVTPDPSREVYRTLEKSEGWKLLDVLDATLPDDTDVLYVDPWGSATESRLQTLLDMGGSLYRVNKERDGLEVRVTPPVQEAFCRTVTDAAGASASGSASDHLAHAWQAAYGIRPHAGQAYGEAIKAVEAAAHAVIEPNNKKATQGSMVKVLSNSRHMFEFELPGGAATEDEARDGRITSVAVVEEMWRMLNRGQTARHGSQDPTVEETLEAARAAVHLAATLVQWFSSGALRRSS
ncbi:hypothetical protein [Streptomyces bohaiensis]|uniref:hypothetical protein n=1 Tax=Streptomyces bohaiensis TaxID=1431344 RepID=UPI003B819B3D